MNQAERIKDFGMGAVQPECLAEGAGGVLPAFGAYLSAAEANLSFERIGLQDNEAAQFANGADGVPAFEQEGSEVEAGGGEIVIEFEGGPVGLGRFGRLPGSVVGQSEMILRLSVLRQMMNGEFEPVDGALEAAFVDHFFSVEQGSGTGFRAAGKPKQDGGCEEAQGQSRDAGIFHGQHNQCW